MITTIFTRGFCVSLTRFKFCWWCHNWFLMMSQWQNNCDARTWKVISSSLDIDFIHGDSQSRSCNKLHSLQWRYKGHDGVSNHQPHGCLLYCLLGRRSKQTSKLRVTGLCVGNSTVTGDFCAQRASNSENVSIWRRHHDCGDDTILFPSLYRYHCVSAPSQWEMMLQCNIVSHWLGWQSWYKSQCMAYDSICVLMYYLLIYWDFLTTT